MGLPPTPPCQELVIVNELLASEKYDCDCQLGSFLENGVKDEAFFYIDKTASEQVNPTFVPVDENQNSPNLSGGTALDDTMTGRMKIAELRKEQEKRGISKNGKKVELCT